MVDCPEHILESTKGIEFKLGTYIDVNERKYSRQEPERVISPKNKS